MTDDGTWQGAVDALSPGGIPVPRVRELLAAARAAGHATYRSGPAYAVLVTWDAGTGYLVRREAERGANWTIAFRRRTASRFRRVGDWAGTWQEARDLAGVIIDARQDSQPPLEVWYIPTAAYEAAHPGRADNGTVLTDTGRRVRIADGARLADVLPGPVPADLDTRHPDTFIARHVGVGWVMAGIGRIERVRSFTAGTVTFLGNRGYRTFGRHDLVEATAKP